MVIPVLQIACWFFNVKAESNIQDKNTGRGEAIGSQGRAVELGEGQAFGQANFDFWSLSFE